MNAPEKTRTMSRDDVINELIEAFVDNNDIEDIAKFGLEHRGYGMIEDEELETEYNSHFGDNITIVE